MPRSSRQPVSALLLTGRIVASDKAQPRPTPTVLAGAKLLPGPNTYARGSLCCPSCLCLGCLCCVCYSSAASPLFSAQVSYLNECCDRIVRCSDGCVFCFPQETLLEKVTIAAAVCPTYSSSTHAAGGFPVCVCVLHIKPFFYSSTSSTPSVRTDSSP